MRKYIFFISISVALLLLASCREDMTTFSTSATLSFSTDTVHFDTIFTSIGSTTQHFKMYNRNNERVKISSIYLGKGTNSKFRINVNGQVGLQVSNLEIAPNDSLYIFVDVFIDPNQDEMLVQDSIVFEVNNTVNDIDLVAWGQDVHLINGQILQSQTWINDKPYLIYNSMLVDTLHTLTIEKGCQIHFHRYSSLYVLGTIKAEGSIDEPIVFQGDRLEEDYDEVPGQWNGIMLLNGSKHNYFNYAEIKNAIIGIQTDTLVDPTVPSLSIHNSNIWHMSYAGIYAQASSILATNTVVSDCGTYAIALTLGGNYDFLHCTIANYWTAGFRNTPSVILNNYYEYDNQNIAYPLERASFNNCIIYGYANNEIGFSFDNSQSFNFEFNNCIIKADRTAFDIPDSYFPNSLFNSDPLFTDFALSDFSLTETSPAIDKASPSIISLWNQFLEFDIEGNSRLTDQAPDIGAYEFVVSE